MQALLVIDAQNEFSAKGQRATDRGAEALAQIQKRVQEARKQGLPIAWIRHFNLPHETPAFVPGTWGSEFQPGMGPLFGSEKEIEFHKSVYGTFTGTDIESWLREQGITSLVLTGFLTHACVSTTAREGIMRGYDVAVDPLGTATFALEHPELGSLTAAQVHAAALLHVINMGASLAAPVGSMLPQNEAVGQL